MLAGAVDSGERLLVEQALHAVLLGHATEGRHHQLLVVMGEVGLLEHRSDLELPGGDLVVAGLGRNALLEQLTIDIDHERQDPIGYRAEIVVVEFLTLGRRSAEQRPTRAHEIGPAVIEVAVDEEVLLFGAGERHDGVDLRVSEELQDTLGVDVERLLRPQDRVSSCRVPPPSMR